MFVIGLIVGLFIGTWLGMVIIALCQVADGEIEDEDNLYIGGYFVSDEDEKHNT